MRDWENVWNKQFGVKEIAAKDFTGTIVYKNSFKDMDSPYGWDVYHIEGDECLVVNLSTFVNMPTDWTKTFFIDGAEYQFVQNRAGGFEICLLQDMDNAKTIELNFSPSLSLDTFDSINVNEILDYQQQQYFRSNDGIVPHPDKNSIWGKAIQRTTTEAEKIWEMIYGDEEAVYDFSGTLILKQEFNTMKKNSWKIDFYTVDDEKVFIAAAKTIDQRAGRKNFIINGVEYTLVLENGQYEFISAKEPDKILLSPELLSLEIEKYFPSFLTNFKPANPIIPNYASLLINLSDFPINELPKVRIMLQKLLKEIDVFQDIFIYLSESNNPYNNNVHNCYIRIFFKSNNFISEDIKIFDVSLILKNVMTLTILNIRTIYNLSTSTSFTMFLRNHNQDYKYLSWFTDGDINKFESKPVRINRGEFIVDQFYFELFINFKGYNNSFVILRSKNNETFYLCNLDINNMSSYIENQILKNNKRIIR